jgi:hypothetical protein
VNGDMTGTLAAPLDPKLGPLQNNGGPTWTRALLIGSPAIDQGTSDGLITDQRGRLRSVDNPAIANTTGGDGTDIGAFEVQSQAVSLAVPQRSGTNIIIRFLSEVGQSYLIERTVGLSGSNWTTVADHVGGTGKIIELNEPLGPSAAFYRVATR